MNEIYVNVVRIGPMQFSVYYREIAPIAINCCSSNRFYYKKIGSSIVVYSVTCVCIRFCRWLCGCVLFVMLSINIIILFV